MDSELLKLESVIAAEKVLASPPPASLTYQQTFESDSESYSVDSDSEHKARTRLPRPRLPRPQLPRAGLAAAVTVATDRGRAGPDP